MNPYLLLVIFAFLSNIACGYQRANTPKFSGKWFFWIHASIPFIIYFRITAHISAWFIPTTICMAVLGQIIGSKWRASRMNEAEIEHLQQIPDLNLITQSSVDSQSVIIPLLNMGGPRTNEDVKDFQEKLFADPLLIRLPLSFLLQNFFAWVLITFRLKAVKERYMEIGGGSPLYKSTAQQAAALRKELVKRGINAMVTFSFNYSPPFPKDTIAKAKRYHKNYLLPLSLYPHYSKATTGSNIQYLKKEAQENYPTLKFLDCPAYYLHDGYIQAFVERIQEAVMDAALEDYYLVFTAHGLPLYFLKEGDPYPFQISKTVAKILAQLNRTQNWTLCYQSSVGPLQWLKPSTDDMLVALSKRGLKKVLMVPVSFVGDHIETIHEIDIEYREEAEHLGITDFRMSKAIESHPEFIRALADTVEFAMGVNPVSNFNNNPKVKAMQI